MAKKGDGKKGTFSFLRLPIAKQYVWPESRRKMVLFGLVGAVLFAGYFAFDFFAGKRTFISNGPVSSHHAGFEKDCASCHQMGKSVTNEKCSACHELVGDSLGAYSFAAHYLYRSGDPKRATHKTHQEVPCFSCHTEHTGRNAQITNVPDSKCLACHEFGSFNQKHPQFDFVAGKMKDEENLDFPHTQHVRETMTRKNLNDIEKACLYCHNPKPDGKAFEPISFDQHCDACHLSATDKTPPLPEADPVNPVAAGAVSLEAIQRKNEPGSRWAFFVSPAEFSRRGGGLVKSPLYHADPWIMENLRRVRGILYPDQGLSDLLHTTGLANPSAPQTEKMYVEAIATLKEYAAELRGHPERSVQDELSRIDGLIKQAERKLRDPSAPLNTSAFVSAPKVNSKLTQEQRDALKTFALDLSEACRKCHVVSDAGILRVESDQRVLQRAEFNHKAHVMQRRCLDCHASIPIAEKLKTTAPIDASIDNASIQNLPDIENCRSCHSPSEVSNRCVTCHEFHPNKANQARLLLYLD